MMILKVCVQISHNLSTVKLTSIYIIVEAATSLMMTTIKLLMLCEDPNYHTRLPRTESKNKLKLQQLAMLFVKQGSSCTQGVEGAVSLSQSLTKKQSLGQRKVKVDK